MSTSPDCHRLRGRSPAFAALTSSFEKPSTRNLSTPPPAVKKLFPKSAGPETSKQSAISDLTSSLQGPLKSTIPKSVKGMCNIAVYILPVVLENGWQTFYCLTLIKLVQRRKRLYRRKMERAATMRRKTTRGVQFTHMNGW
jgi:hypothetical protein